MCSDGVGGARPHLILKSQSERTTVHSDGVGGARRRELRKFTRGPFSRVVPAKEVWLNVTFDHFDRNDLVKNFGFSEVTHRFKNVL